MSEIDIPQTPTTAELQQRYPLSLDAELAIANQRDGISSVLIEPADALFASIGYCALPGRDQRHVMRSEGRQVAALEGIGPSMKTSQRAPAHKARTHPERDWQGEEQTDPEGAYETTRDQAEQYANVAAEVRCNTHLERYSHMLSWIWTGGRNADDDELMDNVALYDRRLPVGNKNGLDGTIETALRQVTRINELRSDYEAPAPAPAPAILVYRGGRNATNPRSWREQYLRALDVTEGKLIVDVAHGSEMAHDPEGNFAKSEAGQILAMEAVLYLAQDNYAPAGIMAEASDLPSRTDPHMPLAVALAGIRELYSIKVGEAIASAA